MQYFTLSHIFHVDSHRVCAECVWTLHIPHMVQHKLAFSLIKVLVPTMFEQRNRFDWRFPWESGYSSNSSGNVGIALNLNSAKPSLCC